MMSLRSSPFFGAFEEFVHSLETTCLICAPYISAGPVDRLIASVSGRGLQDSLHIQVVTDLSIGNLIQGSTDVAALKKLTDRIEHVTVRYLPHIHAKVYISGEELALITSANFTDGGAFANFEYGVFLHDTSLVKRVRSDIEQHAALGGVVTAQRLEELAERVVELRGIVREEQQSINAKLREAAASLKSEAEDQLLRTRVHGRSIHAIFADTILYLLSHGPMSTVRLHERIRDIHPDLCDDSVDRVIDGQHFGKLWKHQVRTAQVHLKRAGLITNDRSRRLWMRLTRSS